MSNIHLPRETVKKQWRDMIASGRMPIIEQETSDGLLTVQIWMDSCGVGFLWGFEDSDNYDCGAIKPRFDGCIKKRGEGYSISFAEIDRMGYSLDTVLQLIWDNINDGILSAYD